MTETCQHGKILAKSKEYFDCNQSNIQSNTQTNTQSNTQSNSQSTQLTASNTQNNNQTSNKINHTQANNNDNLNTNNNNSVNQRLQFFDMDQHPKKSIAKLHGVAREIALYCEEPSKNIPPIDYWRQNQEIYPGLAYCFKRISCIHGSSVPSEKLFSVAGKTVWDRRNKIAPEKVNKIMLIHQYRK